MKKTNCKRFNTAREYFEEAVRICRSTIFWDSARAMNVDDAQEMIEVALKRLEKYGKAHFQGLDGIKGFIGYGIKVFSCEIDNTPRATKKEITKLSRLNKLAGIIRERINKAKTQDEKKFYFRWMFRISKFVNNLKKKYDWRDEMFRENGLVGLRKANGDILVPCGNYDFIHGCDYWDDTTFAIASRDGLYGLIKRDGKGTVVTPFNYLNIDRLDYDTDAVATDKEYNIHIGYRGYRESDCIVSDLIVNGEVIIDDADWISDLKKGAIYYWEREKNKYGFLGVYWDWILTEPIYDRIIINDEQPYFTFVKNGEKGVLTTDKEFVPLEKWNNMTEEQQGELWDSVVGCLIIDFTMPIAITE